MRSPRRQNRVVDVIFIVDMVAQFFTIITIDNGVQGFTLITDQRRIALKYLRSWFFIDFFSTALSGLDFVSVADQGTTSINESGQLRIKMLRVVRVIRLAKLLRLARATRIFQRWELKISVNYAVRYGRRGPMGAQYHLARIPTLNRHLGPYPLETPPPFQVLSLFKATLMVLIYLHWAACLWGMQMAIMPFDVDQTWVGRQNYCVRMGDELPGIDYTDVVPIGFSG